MPGYPPMMPPGYPGVPNPYGGYYGGQYQGQQAGSPAAAQNPPPPHYGGGAPPPPPPSLGGGMQQSQPPPQPPPAAPMNGTAWTEHVTPEGLRYYYNTQTGTSSWEQPPEMMQGRQQGYGQGRGGHNVPPLPPLPVNPGAPPLDKAMEALSIGNGNGGYSAPPAMGGGPGYAQGMHNGGMGGLGGIPALTGLMPGQDGGHLDANGQPVQGGGPEGGMTGWFEQPQVS